MLVALLAVYYFCVCPRKFSAVLHNAGGGLRSLIVALPGDCFHRLGLFLYISLYYFLNKLRIDSIYSSGKTGSADGIG